jgi:glycolate oxidase
MAAEHGVGTLKRSFIADELDPVQLATQRRVRGALDPYGLFNPGKAL